MSLWDRVANWVNSRSEQLVAVKLPPNAGDDEPLRAEQSYVRVWLADLFTARDRGWGRAVYPVVHASVRMRFAGNEGATFTTVAGPAKDALGPGVRRNYALTGLLPFYGGTVELEAGLSELKGESALGSALEVLQSFSSLIGPPLGPALEIAQKVSTGLDHMIEAAEGHIVLGLHDTFVAHGASGGGNVLRPGYLAVVMATESQVSPAALRVVDDRLHLAAGSSVRPLEAFDYMLFRIEARPTRDAWDLPDIEELLQRSRSAILSGNEAESKAFRAAAISKALSSPDLTTPDQQQMARRIDEDLKRAREFGLGAVPHGQRGATLQQIMEEAPMSPERASSLPALRLEDFLREDAI